MRGKLMMYRDQFGQCICAHTVKELREKCGGGRVFKIFRDKPGGKPYEAIHVGYGVGCRWFDAFVPFEAAA